MPPGCVALRLRACDPRNGSREYRFLYAQPRGNAHIAANDDRVPPRQASEPIKKCCKRPERDRFSPYARSVSAGALSNRDARKFEGKLEKLKEKKFFSN